MPSKSDRRIDPDPVSVAVMILGAVGSIATIIDFAEKRIERRGRQRQRYRGQRRIIRDSLFGARLALAQLRKHLEVVRLFIEVTDEDEESEYGSNLMTAPAQFGGASLYLDRSELLEWEELQSEILESTQKLHRHINRIVIELASSGLNDLPRDRVAHLQEAVMQMNQILVRLPEAELGELLTDLENAISTAEEGMTDFRYSL